MSQCFRVGESMRNSFLWLHYPTCWVIMCGGLQPLWTANKYPKQEPSNTLKKQIVDISNNFHATALNENCWHNLVKKSNSLFFECRMWHVKDIRRTVHQLQAVCQLRSIPHTFPQCYREPVGNIYEMDMSPICFLGSFLGQVDCERSFPIISSLCHILLLYWMYKQVKTLTNFCVTTVWVYSLLNSFR